MGNFVVRTLELSKLPKPASASPGAKKEWNWARPEDLPRSSLNALDQLTEREREVLLLLVSGLPNKSIAEKLFVSAGTIKTHTLNIYQKMDVPNRTSAIMKALELGWII